MTEDRERYITTRALLMAVYALERLSPERQPEADYNDMLDLVNEPRYRDFIDRVLDDERARPLPPVVNLAFERQRRGG